MEKMTTIPGKRRGYTVSRDSAETRPAGIDRPAPEVRDAAPAEARDAGQPRIEFKRGVGVVVHRPGCGH